MTDAERQARYRATRATGQPVIRTRRPVDRRGLLQRWNDTRAEFTDLQGGTPPGWKACRTINKTARPLMRCERLSNSISTSCWRSNRHAASGGIEQPDGPYGMGHDDAWQEHTGSSRSPPEPRVDARV